jgi:hypothetical protein
MCELTLAVSHPHRRRTSGSRGATQRGVWSDLGGVPQLTLWRQEWSLVRFIFIFYFVIRLPLYNKYSDVIVTFISIHSVIIYVVFLGACMRCTRLCSLKPECYKIGKRICFVKINQVVAKVIQICQILCEIKLVFNLHSLKNNIALWVAFKCVGINHQKGGDWMRNVPLGHFYKYFGD